MGLRKRVLGEARMPSKGRGNEGASVCPLLGTGNIHSSSVGGSSDAALC